VLALAALPAGSASASTSFGATLSSGSGGETLDCTMLSFPLGGPASTGCTAVLIRQDDMSSAAAPVSGVLVSLTLRMQTAVTGHLRVLHDVGGTAGDVTNPDAMTYVSTGPAASVPGDDAQHTYPAQVPITTGDYIAFGTSGASSTAAIYRSAMVGKGERIYRDSADGTAPSEGSLDPVTAFSIQAPIRATIEPDADGDGYGDETQDQCPTKPGPGPCPPGGTRDTTPPVLSSYIVSPSSFVAANTGPSVVAAAKVGTTVVYKLSERAAVTFAVQQRKSGKKKGKRCVAGRAKKKRRRCNRYVTVPGTFSQTGAAGLNSFKFMGRLKGKALKPGNYRLVAVAADAAGNRSGPARKPFRIVKG
jgi:hypothetical protein